MKKIIVKKNNEVDEFFCIDIFENHDVENNKLEKAIKSMVEQLSKSNFNFIIKLMDKIKEICNKDDLDKFVDEFFLTYRFANANNRISGFMEANENRANYVYKFFNKDPNTATKNIVKNIADNYYYDIFVNLPSQQIEELLRIDAKDLENLLSLYNDNNDNYFYSQFGSILMGSIYRMIYLSFFNNNLHQCWNCSLANASDCIKVLDYMKRNILAYPFITDGFQVVEKAENNKYFLDRFIVSKCNNFKKMRRK